MKQILTTGVIRSPHGIKGFVKVHPLSDDFSHFRSLKEVVLQKSGKNKTMEIEQVQNHGVELLVKFKGVDTPEDARFISGWDILVPREQASKLGKGDIYTADLPGMKLIYDNEEIGTVLSTFEGAQALLLEVECKDKKIRMVPYIKGIFIDEVDAEKGTIKLLKKELCIEY